MCRLAAQRSEPLFGGTAGTLDLEQPQGLSGTISGWQVGDVIDFVSTSVTSAGISGSTLTVTVSGGSAFTYQLAGQEAEHGRQLYKAMVPVAPMSLWLPKFR